MDTSEIKTVLWLNGGRECNEKKSAFREDWIERKILSSYLAMFNVIFI